VPAAARPLVAADVAGVAAIERAAFTDPWPPQAFFDLLAQPHVRAYAVDRDDGVLAGYALASVAADQGEILNLAVDPAAQRRGLGRLLLDALLDMFRREKIASIFLEVRQSNAGAIHLYGAAGFRAVSTRRRYYRYPTENALTMVLDLAGTGANRAEKG
jgi:[ribosomal protein S18]-alanine N-acetyltransferase